MVKRIQKFSKKFAKINSLEGELKKLSILRIILGFILIIRTFQILYVAHYTNDVSNHFGYLVFILMFMFTLGIFLPIVTLGLIFLLPVLDLHYQTSTLGTAIAIQFLLVLFFSNSGVFYSLDSIFLKSKKNIISVFCNKIYSLIGTRKNDELSLIYFLGFMSYGIVSFAAIMYHLQDKFWVGGNTVNLFFTGAYLSKYYDFFRGFYLDYPNVYCFISYVMVIGQSIFQLFMIPLAIFKYGYFFVKYWSLSFFIASLFMINLSYLPHIEILFWIALFYLPGIKIKSTQSEFKEPIQEDSKWLSKFLTTIYLSFFTIYLFFRLPYVKEVPFKIISVITNESTALISQNYINTLTYRFGLDLPIVFNEVDLMMNEKWFVLYRIQDDKKILVPLLNEEGGRLDYFDSDYLFFSNHGSDLLYFGTILRYRRLLSINDVSVFHQNNNTGRKIIERLVRFDINYNSLPKNSKYYLEVRENNCIRVNSNNMEKYSSKIIYSDTIQIL